MTKTYSRKRSRGYMQLCCLSAYLKSKSVYESVACMDAYVLMSLCMWKPQASMKMWFARMCEVVSMNLEAITVCTDVVCIMC